MDLFFKLVATIKSPKASFRRKPLMRFPFAEIKSSWIYSFIIYKIKVAAVACLFCLLSFYSFGQDGLLQQKSARLFKTGVELMSQNQYAAARENFNQYISVAPNGSEKQDAEYYRAICSLNLYHADAEKQVQDFIDNYPSNPKSSAAYVELATFFYNEKNYKKATTYFAKADFGVLSTSEQNTAHFRWGYSLFSQKILKDALDQFNYVKTQGGQYGPASSYYAGYAEFSQGDYTNALIDLKRAEQSEAYSAIVPYMMANVYYKQKDYNGLIGYAQTVSSRKEVSNAEEIALLVAEAYYKKADYKNALAGYDKYLTGKESTANKSVLLRAGYSAFVLNQDSKALTYLKNSFEGVVDSVGYYSSYYLGQLYLRGGQKAMALTAFDMARKFKPDQKLVEESSFQFAKISYDIGRPDQAIKEFEGILKNFPSGNHTIEIKELLSQAYVNANNFNKAIEYIEALPNWSKSVERAYQKATLLKGMESFNQENYDQAIAFFDKSLQHPIDSDYELEANFWSGEAFSIARKYDEAAKKYLAVINKGDDNSTLVLKSRYGLGYTYFNLRQYDKALFSFKEFVLKSPSSQPNLSDGTLRLADCYYMDKSYGDALLYYKKAFNTNSPDNDYAHFQAGNILGIQRKYAEAKTEFSLVLRNYSGSRFLDQARFQLGQLEFEQGNYENAKNSYTELINSNPSSPFTPTAYVRRAASYFNLKDYNKTAQDYITVLEDYASNPVANEVLLPLQEALNLAGRSDEFDKYLALAKKNIPDAKGIEAVEFEAAKNLYFDQKYENAIKNLDAYINSYKESPRNAEAKYYEAESYYRLKNPKALPIYYELSGDKTFSFAVKVTSRIAELEFKQTNYTKAIPFFQLLAREATNKRDQFNAWSGLMESYFYLNQYDSTEKYAHIILEKGSVNAGAQNKASLFLGKAAMGKNDYELAKDEFLATINSAQDEYGAEAKYHLAEILYLTKEYKQCYQTLISLNTDFASYTDWVGKSYLLLADDCLAMNDSYQAKATLQSLIDNFPLDEIKKQATLKLNKIRDEELKKQAPEKIDTLSNDKN
ncbi:MAG TPA: hypothetical protein DGG95_08860 [Cytophagales bacterium]|jgi:TolA-binding protein|nr:hypothetical protein [Cytophagales bacterium]